MVKLTRSGSLEVVTGPVWPGVSYFCTTRHGGVSEGPWASLNLGPHTQDSAAHVVENRRRLGFEPDSVVWVRQVHGTRVHDADASMHAKADPVEADALITASRHRVLAIMTADCLPVVLGSADGQHVGVAHAGWRGLLAGVLENTLAALQSAYKGPGMPLWRAWIGPGISQAHFEVGDEVRRAFVGTDAQTSTFFIPAGRTGKWRADLTAIARHRLIKSGVRQVDACNLCTYEHTDLFYSYRRDRVTGRLVTVAWRT